MPDFDHAFDWARRHVEHGPLPTAVLGVATDAGTVALDAFGSKGGRAASVDDHYPLFSVTKPIVGLAALRLIEAGRLTAETPLSAAIPEFGPDRDDVVRLRHLVSHTSGIIEPPLDTPGGLRPSLLAPGRDFAAGTVSRYSTIAFEGIAALIEHASGAPWERAVASVGERADATGLTFEADASSHAPVDAAGQGLDYARFAALRHPGAGLFGRAADLLAIGSALLRNDGSLIAPVTLRRDAAPAHGGVAEARAVSGEPRPGLGLHVEPPPLLARPARERHLRPRRLGGRRVLDHAIARRVLHPAHERRRRIQSVRRRRRPAAQRGGGCRVGRHPRTGRPAQCPPGCDTVDCPVGERFAP
jgi:CubicO group peptidase (beta-lactamase class C family)